MRNLFITVLLFAVLAGCASNTAKVTHRTVQIDESFAFNGRVAIRQGHERTASGLRWVHGKDGDEILMLAPLGQTVARLHRDMQGIVLEAEGKRYVATDAESLTQQVLGWELPLTGLRYWVVAAAAHGDVAQASYNDKGQLASLEQDGWKIEYSRYADDTADSLPLRFVMHHGDLEILVLIDEWEKQ